MTFDRYSLRFLSVVFGFATQTKEEIKPSRLCARFLFSASYSAHPQPSLHGSMQTTHANEGTAHPQPSLHADLSARGRKRGVN